MARHYWLVKSEPQTYAWEDLVRDGGTYWDGVRNPQARNYLRQMTVGDLALYYHSGQGREVVGVARVTEPAYPDPTTADERWVVVDLAPVKALRKPVTLAQIRAEPGLAGMALLRQSRLSVMPVAAAEFRRILELAGTRVR